MKLKKSIIAILVLLILSIGIILYFSVFRPYSQRILIGGVVPFSGEFADYGFTMKEVANLRVQEWNKSGGINGKKIEIVWADGGCDKKISQNAAKELIEQHNVPVILGGLCSEETLNISSVSIPQKNLLLSPISTSSDLGSLGKYVFSMGVSNAEQADAIVQHAARNLYQKIGILIGGNAYSENLLSELEKQYKGDIYASKIDSTNEVNINSAIEEMIKKEVEVLILIFKSPTVASNVIKELEASTWDKEIILDTRTTASAEIVKEFKPFLSRSNVLGLSSFKNAKKLEFESFKMDYFLKYGWRMDDYEYALPTIDAVDIILEEMTFSKNNIINLDTLLSYQHSGFTGGVKFNQNGIREGKFTLMRFHENEFVPL